ncbi:dynamin family protein [Helicobacter pylori]|uniref:dynamin family protein n=1 Tax=Helicobacter pylori TaxID=210 RepID=UPI001FD6CA8B|nr:dynamin family protein [Helicobacter pylori]UOR43989.1 dynamin family protein [Helicobacter pylori]
MGIDWLKDLNFKSSEDLEAHENESHDLELERLKKQHGVIARVLNAKMENKGLAEYQRVLNNEFLAFSNEVEFKEQTMVLHALQELGNELQLVASYPSLFQKNMVAVGGGFSAGKSSFLNHLLGLNLKLPENLTPTTAIPTYCLKGEREVLMGVSQNGGVVELPNFSFDHETLNAFGFDLKSIMPFMILSSPTMLFKHLCFIDTPGYDAPNQGYTGGDRQASKEYLNHAKHILWLISCERGGIEKSDLDYLQELYEEGKQVFIVLDKADLKITIQLEEIAVQTKETLEDNGIEFLGIGVYSSERYQEIKEFSEKSPVFDSLEKFLTELNKKSEKQNEILKVLYKVGLAYEKAIKEDLSKFKRYQDALHSIKLDLMQKGFDDFSDASFNKIESLKKEFSEQERSKRENLAQLNQVINLFKKSIDKVFDRVSAFTWEKYKEENDDEENDEENYREFEEIKKMVLYFRDCWMFVVEQLDGKSSQTELQKYKGFVSRNNKLLQLEFSMKNLLTLRQFKDTYREWYSKLRQLNEAKEVVSEIRGYWLQELPTSAKDLISYCSTLLKLDYSLENLQKLRRFKDNFKKDYQKCKRSR